MTKISALIPTWNGSRTIIPCLNSLLHQTQRLSEIIVVDNGSTDNTSSLVSMHFPQVKLIKLPENTGVVGGRNTGISHASKSSEYLLFFDHDMIANKDMISHLLLTAKKYSAGIITPKIFYKDHPNLVWAAGTGINLITGQVLFRNGSDTGQFSAETEVQVAPAVLLVNRQVIDKSGKFDPVFVSSWEDTDFCFRAKRNGFSTYFSPLAVAYHDLKLDPKAEAERLLYRYGVNIGRNRIIFMRRYAPHYYLFLALFLPVYLLYYFRLAIRVGDIASYSNFLRGTWQGLTFKQ